MYVFGTASEPRELSTLLHQLFDQLMLETDNASSLQLSTGTMS